MKLLFDQNLSPRLVEWLKDMYPDSAHVLHCGLAQAFDREVWAYARRNDFVLVSKDADFSEMSVVLGFPPKVVWIRRGNCSTRDIERLLRAAGEQILALEANAQTGVLELH